jgi:hypothetical protein
MLWENGVISNKKSFITQQYGSYVHVDGKSRQILETMFVIRNIFGTDLWPNCQSCGSGFPDPTPIFWIRPLD